MYLLQYIFILAFTVRLVAVHSLRSDTYQYYPLQQVPVYLCPYDHSHVSVRVSYLTPGQ